MSLNLSLSILSHTRRRIISQTTPFILCTACNTGIISRKYHRRRYGTLNGVNTRDGVDMHGMENEGTFSAPESRIWPESGLKYIPRTHPEIPLSTQLSNPGFISAKHPLRDLSEIPMDNQKLQVRRLVRETHPQHPIATESSSATHNYGVFVTQPIQRDEVLGEYTGAIVPEEAIHDTSYAVSLGNGTFIDASKCGNMFRFVNDYRNIANAKNVEVSIAKVQWNGKEVLVPVFYATRDIVVGEELLWDYGTDYWVPRADLLGPNGKMRLKLEGFIAEFGLVSMLFAVLAGFWVVQKLFDDEVLAAYDQKVESIFRKGQEKIQQRNEK